MRGGWSPRAGGATACALLAGWYVVLYGDCTQYFFHWDDFRFLGAASRLSISTPRDLIEFLRPGPASTFFYRPLSETGYFWLLRQLFAYDAAPYHAVQLTANIANAVLVYALATTILHSRPAGFATAMLYAAAPGHAIAVNWNAAFSMTGTAFWYFATLLAWLRLRGWRRSAVCTLLFAVSLLSGEAATTIPVVLTLGLVLDEAPPLPKGVAALLPIYLLGALYAAAKVWYFSFVLVREFPDPMHRALVVSHYGPTFAPLDMLQTLGFYCACSFSWLYGILDDAALLKGIAVVWLAFLAASFVWARRSTIGRTVGFGLSFFVVALGPLLTLPNHRYMYLIGVAAFGSSLALVAAVRAIPYVGRWVAAAVVIATLAVEAVSTAAQVRDSSEFRFVRDFQAGAAGWLQTVERQARRDGGMREVVVPANTLTDLVFKDAAGHRLFYAATYEVAVVKTLPRSALDRGRIALGAAPPWRPGTPLPGQQARWDWLR